MTDAELVTETLDACHVWPKRDGSTMGLSLSIALTERTLPVALHRLMPKRRHLLEDLLTSEAKRVYAHGWKGGGPGWHRAHVVDRVLVPAANDPTLPAPDRAWALAAAVALGLTYPPQAGDALGAVRPGAAAADLGELARRAASCPNDKRRAKLVRRLAAEVNALEAVRTPEAAGACAAPKASPDAGGPMRLARADAPPVVRVGLDESGAVTVDGRVLTHADGKGARRPLHAEGVKTNRLAVALVAFARGEPATLRGGDIRKLNAALGAARAGFAFADGKAGMGPLCLDARRTREGLTVVFVERDGPEGR